VTTLFVGQRNRVWRRLQPGDEAGLCRAYAAWGRRRRLGHWLAGPGLPYAACIAGVSAQLVEDAGDDYRAPCAADRARAICANDAVYVLASCDALCLAADPAAAAAPHIDPYAALGDALTWLWHCGGRGDVDTACLVSGQVEEAVVSLANRAPDLYPIAFRAP